MPHNKNSTGSSAELAAAWVGRDGPRGLGGQGFLITINPSGVMKPSDGQCPHSALCKARGDVIAWTKILTGALLWALHMASCGLTLEANMPRQHGVPTHPAPVLVGSAGTMVAPKPSRHPLHRPLALLLQEHPQPHGSYHWNSSSAVAAGASARWECSPGAAELQDGPLNPQPTPEHSHKEGESSQPATSCPN